MATPDYNIIPQLGLVGYASFAAASAKASAVTIITTDHLAREMLIANSLNADMTLTLTLPNGTITDWIYLPASTGGGVDGIRVTIPAGSIVKGYYLDSAPSAGRIGLTPV